MHSNNSELARPLARDGKPFSRRRLHVLLTGLAVGLLLSELDANVFATALPTIVGELSGVSAMLWVTTAYVAAATVTMPVYGKLGDLMGRRRLFLSALSIFVLGSVVGGLAPDMRWLITARAVQGVGGGGLLILIQAIVADLVPARRRTPYLAAVDAVFALSALVGPLLGGWFAEGIGWRWAFWVNLPLGAVAIVAAVALLPESAPATRRVSVDVSGICALAVAVSSTVLLAAWGGTVHAWTSPVMLAVAGTALVSTLAFVAAERRAVEPVLPLHLFGRRNFTVATVAGLLMAVAMFGAIGYLPTYLQMVHRLSATHAGLLMLTLIGGLGLFTVVAAKVVSRTGRYRWLPVTGAAVVAVSLALMSTMTASTSLVVTGLYLFLLGAGIGCGLEILLVVVQNTVAPAELGTATAANSFFREIGVSLGSAVVGTLFSSRLAVLLTERLPVGMDLDHESLTPQRVHALPDALRSVVASAYNDALTPVFWAIAPLMVLSAVALCFLKPVPLATAVAVQVDGEGADERLAPA